MELHEQQGHWNGVARHVRGDAVANRKHKADRRGGWGESSMRSTRKAMDQTEHAGYIRGVVEGEVVNKANRPERNVEMKEYIKQAKREIEAEKKREKVEEAKNVLRQIEQLQAQLSELQKQIREM